VAALAFDRPRGAEAAAGRMAELAVRDQDIAFYQARAARDPWSAADLTSLAALYLQRARESGDYEDWRRAEGAARRSLLLRESRNTRALHVLAAALLGQHRFIEARTAAERLVELEPDRPSYRALLGEIQMELGDYDVASRSFAGLLTERRNLAVAPRLARWAELTGHPERARAVLLEAREEAMLRVDLPREQVTWFHLRLGELASRHGRLDEAEEWFETGLSLEPNDFRLWSALARVAMCRGDWRRAVRYGDRAVAINSDLGTLALLGDAYRALGDSVRSAGYYAAVESTAAAQPEPYNRVWTQFRLDHAIGLEATRALLERELESRRDVLGYDLVAWARFLTGDLAGARSAITGAIRLGTRDATLLYHAGAIAAASGSREEARRLLAKALEMNPRFHHRLADSARSLLGVIERAPGGTATALPVPDAGPGSGSRPAEPPGTSSARR
jgi:tetratricopeptide (TPR) repeat protein